ncbi:MAG: hypothetical protein RL499_383 [Actinomycetota bacterium]
MPLLAVSALLVVSPGFASDSLVIDSALSGSTVSGELLVEGSTIGEDIELVTLALAPQTLVDCGAPIAESVVTTDANRFTGSIATESVPDGSYCVIAEADDGRLSTVLGGITVDNAVELGNSIDDFQLPTQSLDDAAAATASAAPSRFGELASLGPIVLAATAGLAVGVLALGFWARRRAGVERAF